MEEKEFGSPQDWYSSQEAEADGPGIDVAGPYWRQEGEGKLGVREL